MAYHWTTKKFKTQAEMDRWIEKNEGKVQYNEVFIDNGYAVEWRQLRKVSA